ncbi:MAG: DUF6602 domain-containing protein [Actinomycetota bacterium]
MTDDVTPNKLDLHEAYLQKQKHLIGALELTPAFTSHPGTVGEETEANWINMLTEFLPGRYQVSSGQVVDHTGMLSDQIDVMIHDRQYSPLFFQGNNGTIIVPAESVYAVFEVKQEINKTLSDYAGAKIESVRRLKRTSVPIRHAGGVFEPQAPKYILGGMLTTRNGWADLKGDAAVRQLRALTGNRRIDIGCALQSLSFDMPEDREFDPEYSTAETTLIFFVLRLFRRLQAMGTVVAADVDAYAEPTRGHAV